MPDKRSTWLLLLDILDRPATALVNVATYPRWRWLLPAILAVVTLVVFTAVSAPLLAAQAQELMAGQLSRLSADQAALVQGQVARFSSPLVVTLTGSLAAIVSLPAGWLIQAAIVYFGALIAGGDVEFGWIFATAPWLGIHFVLETILQTIYVSTQGKLLVNHGLSYLVSTGKPLADARNASYVALRQASLFRLWNLLLVYVLLRSVGKLGRGSAFLVTVIYLSLLVGGQVVAQLDTADLDLAVSQAQISLRTAQAQLQQLQDGPSVSDLAASQTVLASAQANYQQLLWGTDADQLAAAAGQVEQAQVQVQHAQEAYDKVKDMPNVGMFPQSIQLQQATINNETAQAQYRVSARGANQAQLAGAQAQIAQAQAIIDKLQRGPSASQLEIAQAGVDQAQLAVEQAQRRLENARIEAPSDGVVTAVNIVAGSLAQPGTPAIQISDISRFHIDVLVDEADIASIAVSQPVTLELDALTNQKLAGHVSMISPAATPGTGGVVSYEVTVTIDPTDAPLRAGMSATAIITSSSHENVLLVPNRSVQIARDSGKSYVERLTNGVPQRIEVRLGLRDDTQSEVREGLVDGERGSSATSAASSNCNRALAAPRNSATSHDRRK